MLHEAFTSGNFDTHFVKHYYTPEVLKKELDEDEAKIAVALVGYLMEQAKKPTNGAGTEAVTGRSNWKANRANWR